MFMFVFFIVAMATIVNLSTVFAMMTNEGIIEGLFLASLVLEEDRHVLVVTIWWWHYFRMVDLDLE